METEQEQHSLVDYACALGDRGYFVLPLLIRDDRRKIPLIKWGSSASKDAEDIRAMPWEDATHVAVACEPSGLVVVDLDTYYDEDLEALIEGDDLLPEWFRLCNGEQETDGEILDPPWIPTAGNGIHIFLRADPSNPVQSTVKEISHCIDTRGVGGQYGGIVAIYAEMPEISELPMAPAWLSQLTQQVETSKTPEAPPEAPKYGEGEAGTDYGIKALRDELRAIQASWDEDAGHFNNDLNTSAFAIGQLAASGELNAEHAHHELQNKLQELGAGTDQYKTIDSGFSAGLKRPRQRATVTREILDEMAKEWISSRGLDELPPPEWLLPGWLELNSVAQIFGEPGVGKSFIALDIAARVSRGMGWPTDDNRPKTPFKVGYVIAEGVAGLAERKRAWEAAYGQVGDLRFYPKALQIPHDERDDKTKIKWEAAVTFLTEWGASMIVIDTQARCTLGVEENSPKEMNLIYDTIEDLQRKTGACVLLVHHTAKGGQTARGTNAVKGALTTEIHLRKSYGRIRVKCSKQKNAIEPNEIYFKLEDSGNSVIPKLSIEVPADMDGLVQTANSKMLIRQFLQEHPDVPQTTNEIMEATGVSRSKLSTSLNEMADANEVIKSTVRRPTSKGPRNQSAYLWNPPVSVAE